MDTGQLGGEVGTCLKAFLQAIGIVTLSITGVILIVGFSIGIKPMNSRTDCVEGMVTTQENKLYDVKSRKVLVECFKFQA